MYLEAVVVCVNYSDFLSHTLPHNKHHFDRMVVVTTPTDYKTIRLCNYHNVECIKTNVFYDDGNVFNKGAGINEGLKVLSKSDWVVHLDADIYLPPLTRTALNNIPLESNKIYGCDRLMVPNYESWEESINNPKFIHSEWAFIHLNSFPVGTRIADYNTRNQGWQPIGFFQLWNPKGSQVFTYPDKHGECDRTDVILTKNFERKNRVFLPEIVVLHLDSEGGDDYVMGTNWKGRKTKFFGPSKKSNIKFSFLKRIVKKILRTFKCPKYKAHG